MDFYFKSLFSGIAQVILHPCAITGVICLLGIALNSLVMALGALLGTIAGTSCAYLLNHDYDDIQLGLYGFNATLIGIASIANFYFFQVTTTSVLILIFSCITSVFIAKFISMKLKLTPYTLPLVLITWCII